MNDTPLIKETSPDDLQLTKSSILGCSFTILVTFCCISTSNGKTTQDCSFNHHLISSSLISSDISKQVTIIYSPPMCPLLFSKIVKQEQPLVITKNLCLDSPIFQNHLFFLPMVSNFHYASYDCKLSPHFFLFDIFAY